MNPTQKFCALNTTRPSSLILKQKTILKARKTGARVREERYTQTCDGDGAPTRIVYDALVYAGLLRPRPGKLRWTLTPMGHAALQFV